MRKCTTGPIEQVTDGHDFSGWGFVIYDDIGKPRLTLSYLEKKDAEAGYAHVNAALVKAVVSEA